jgi:hypothetical protein
LELDEAGELKAMAGKPGDPLTDTLSMAMPELAPD